MADTLDPNKVDKRTWARYARSGQLDAQAYKQWLESLPDVGEKAATVSTRMYEDERLDESADEVDEVDDADTGAEEQSAPEGTNPEGLA